MPCAKNTMREVAVVAYAQSPMVRDAGAHNDVEMLMPVLEEVRSRAGLRQQEIDFTCSGSCDYMQGVSFSFVEGVDALGAVPPIKESHVEMDAAWALYEAWLKILTGHADTALIYGFSKSSPGALPLVLSLQLDPYYLAPLWVDSVSLAAMQARALLDRGLLSERDLAQVVARSRANALRNPNAQLSAEVSAEQLLEEPFHVAPLRRHDCAPITDGASAMIIAAKDTARNLCQRPVFIRGLDHRMESSHPGVRDLCASPSTALAGSKAGVDADRIDVAELYAPFSHQEIILQRALALGDEVDINPSGGALAGNIMMAAGLDRIGEAAARIASGAADRGVAHATSGPCLQQNMVLVLEGA